MSRRHRPLGAYKRAVKKLAEKNPQYIKYLGREDFTPHEKAAIARVAKLPPLPQRSNADWVHVAEKLSKFAPGLKKYRRRKKLNSGEKSAIAHKEKILRYSENLIPIPARDRKKALKEKWDLFAPGVFAMPLGNTGKDAKIIHVAKHMTVTSNGRTWVYWRLPNIETGAMEKAAEKAFTEFEATFDIEKLAKLAKKAFEDFKLIKVYLWAKQGRVGFGYKTFNEFTQWLYEYYSQYQNTEEWVEGIAIKIEDDGTGKDLPTPAEHRKQEKKRYKQLRKQRKG